jgi:hypothetical protein
MMEIVSISVKEKIIELTLNMIEISIGKTK